MQISVQALVELRPVIIFYDEHLFQKNFQIIKELL